MKTIRSLRFSLVLAPLSLALVAGCGGPTAEDVIDQSTPAICAKAEECNAGTFNIAYPRGVDECTEKTKAETKRQRASDLDKRSVCSDDELKTCLDELEKAACPADGSLPQPPCDC